MPSVAPGLATLIVSLAAPAISAPLPWAWPGTTPLPATARSVEVAVDDVALHFEPNARANVRGSASLGAVLPIFGVHPAGAGCTARWLLVGSDAWICEQDVRLSTWPPPDNAGTDGAEGTAATSAAGALPFSYYFVGPDGSLGYNSFELAGEGIPDSQLEPGFAVAVVRTSTREDGEVFAETSHALWLPMRDLTPAQTSTFRGTELHADLLNVAWVVGRDAPQFERPFGRQLSARLPKHTQVEVRELQGLDRPPQEQWVQTQDGTWLRRSALARPTSHSVPLGVGQEERWLFVDTAEQTLTAYVGARPVFATLISSGRGRGQSPTATPPGHHRIWVKLRSTDMTNLEENAGEAAYAIEDVPWVMFFKGGYGLHGAFWHDAFGSRRSHGCVNLSPADAAFLFHWTAPNTPPGWHATHPTKHDRGTLVVVE